MKRNGISAFSILSRQTGCQKNFKIKMLIITFKKYLKTIHGQTVLEYSLLLIVIAAMSLLIIAQGIKSSNPIENPIRRAVDQINLQVTGDPANLLP